MKQNIIFSILAIAFILLLSGCVNEGLIVKLNEPFSLAYGENATVSSENLSVQFTEIKEDSRCATGVQCVWEGRGVVLITLSKNNQLLGTATLATNDSIKTVGNYVIELVNLSPYPIISDSGNTQAINPTDYVVTLTVNRI